MQVTITFNVSNAGEGLELATCLLSVVREGSASNSYKLAKAINGVPITHVEVK